MIKNWNPVQRLHGSRTITKSGKSLWSDVGSYDLSESPNYEGLLLIICLELITVSFAT